ncbi:MAG: thiamine-phosphate kinase [Endomicrobiales bacterium]|nr:thiamine-phosphate kinase [Endomicrobiales bacterium]
MKTNTVKSLGEFGVIERIKKAINSGKTVRGGVPTGIGDDAFVAGISKKTLLVATTDILVENVHFRRDWMAPFELGYKAMAANLSDLAAMGPVKPLYGLVGLALVGDISVNFVDKLYLGMNKIAGKYGLKILGGDTVSTQKNIVISITLIGEIEKNKVITRSGARPGDIIAVSGPFGDSSGGLFLLKRGIRPVKPWQKKLVRKHLLPEPRFDVSSKMAPSTGITSLIDSSDGLSASVGFLCLESGVGAKIELDKVPVSNELRKFSGAYKRADVGKMIISGGEEYELVFTVKPAKLRRIKRKIRDLREIGVITKEKKITYYLNGKPRKIDPKGFEHFSQ